jgi:hypothetical protein
MAKKKSGWNSLTPTQQANWKAENFSKSIKVSESTIQGLRAGKTFEGNVAKFKNGATAEEREAMNRFYGKTRVNTALGSTVTTVNKTYPNPYKVSPGPNFKGVGQNNYKAPKAKQNGPSWDAFVNSTEVKSWTKGLGYGVATVATLFGPGKFTRGPKIVKDVVTKAIGPGKVPKAITSGKTVKAVTSGKKPKAITAAPVRKQITAGPAAGLDAKYAAAAARSKAAAQELQKAVKNQKKGLLTSGEVRAVQRTAELERMNVGIIANKARAARGLKPMPIKVGPVFKKATTSRTVAKPAGSGRTKASDLPTSQPRALGKAPKTAKKAPTPKQRQKANTAGAKDMRRAIAPGASRVTPAGSRSRLAVDTKTEATRARLTAQLEKKGPGYRQELRSKYAGGRNTEQRAWEKRVAKQGGGPKSGASVTAASKAAKKRGVDVTVGKSKEAIKAARPKKVAKKTATKRDMSGRYGAKIDDLLQEGYKPKKVAKKTTKKTATRGKK